MYFILDMWKLFVILGLSASLVAGVPKPVETDEEYEDDVCLTSADSEDPEKECIFPFKSIISHTMAVLLILMMKQKDGAQQKLTKMEFMSQEMVTGDTAHLAAPQKYFQVI